MHVSGVGCLSVLCGLIVFLRIVSDGYTVAAVCIFYLISLLSLLPGDLDCVALTQSAPMHDQVVVLLRRINFALIH